MIRFTTLLLLLAATAAIGKRSSRIVSSSRGDIQGKIGELFTGLGTDDVEQGHHHHQPFPYTDTHLYKDPEAVKNFTRYWDEGFLHKYDVFTYTCQRTGRDTASLYQLFYNAKDFETFYKIGKWAKSEVHPEQYVMALMSAVYHRVDTHGVATPAYYEIFPNYFVPSTVLNQAYRAQLHGVSSRSFEMNNTGWDWSWHHGWGMTSPFRVYLGDKQFYDVESRLSYFREDVSRVNMFVKAGLIFSSAYPYIDFPMKGLSYETLGQLRYSLIHDLHTRYNLERYAVGLPPVEPINFHQPIKTGYDSQMSGLYGRPISGRPDYVTPSHINPDGVQEMENLYNYFHEAVDLNTFWSEATTLEAQEIKGVNQLANFVLTGNKRQYSSLYYNLLAFVDGVTTSTNKYQYTPGTLLNMYTMHRDPAFYQILAYIDSIFSYYHSRLPSYTKHELDFPGVKVTGFEVSPKLETYDSRFEFDISNAVPGSGSYKASQFVVNTKPYSSTYKIHSDKESSAVVKVFVGPATDARNTTLTFNELRESLTLFDVFPVKLHTGENVFHRNPHGSSQESQGKSQRMQQPSVKEGCSHFYYGMTHLPRGSPSGLPVKFYVTVHPYDGPHEMHYMANHHAQGDFEYNLHFPVDRYWSVSPFDFDNHYVADQYIYHSHH